MDYQQFVHTIKEELTLILGADMDVRIQHTLKNNGRERTGITIATKNTNLFPTIYMEEYFRQYELGVDIETIANLVLEVYYDIRTEHIWDFESINQLDSILSKITFKLIHAERNQKLLSTMPFVPFHDLAIVFYVLFHIDENGVGTLPVTNQLAASWKVTSKELLSIAQMNSPELLPASFRPMTQVIEEMLNASESNIHPSENVLYVLTNSLKNFGASAILYDGILEQIAGQLGENFYVIPSSIHEMLIIPESESPGYEELRIMVKEANRDHVEVEEVLSDRVYYYDVNTKQLI